MRGLAADAESQHSAEVAVLDLHGLLGPRLPQKREPRLGLSKLVPEPTQRDSQGLARG